VTYPTLQPCTPEYLYKFLREQLLPPVRSSLEIAEGGQRIRITTLPGPVMEDLCEALQGDDRWVARVLVGTTPNRAWMATATKLIELRNTLTKPLMIFIPPGLRTAAEDSLDIATFRELSLSTSVTNELIAALVQQVPPPLVPSVSDILTHVRREKWARNDDELVNYLLTVNLNGSTSEAVGGALFVFGLIPHFSLAGQSNIPYWLSRNRKMQQVLSDLRQPIQTRITQLPLEPSTIQPTLFAFLRERAAQDPRAWTAEIACNADYQALSLDHWPFIESADDTQLRIRLEPLTLPMQSADDVGGTTPLPVLNLDGKDALKISFRAIPAPPEVPVWKTYRIQLVLVDGDQPTVVWESNGFKKPATRQKVNRTIKPGDLQSLEEGTYFARVDAYDQDGALLTQPRKIDPVDTNSRSENESEYFLVVREGVEVVAPAPRAIDLYSFAACWVEANVRSIAANTDEDGIAPRSSITGTWTEPVGSAPKGEAHFKLEGEGVNGFTIIVPSLLRRLELSSLEHPDQLGRFQLDLANVRNTTDVEIKRSATEVATGGFAFDSFLGARRRVFELILNQHRFRLGERAQDPTCKSLVETGDVLALSDDIQDYGKKYLALIEESFLGQGHSRQKGLLFKTLASLDATEVRWNPSLGDPGRALLLSPTHPLRLVWHLQHFNFCESALRNWRERTATVPSWPTFLRQLSNELLPINSPMVMFDRRGRAYVEQGLLTSHWSLFLPDRSSNSVQVDTSASRETCRRLLGLRKSLPVTAVVGSAEIATRAFEYLQQHPYVEQLKINVFNPGDGQLITDALRALEGFRQNILTEKGPPALRYSVQMFGSRSQVETMGEAFESLLDPERQVAEDDEFTLTSSNHLLPKLIFARNPLDDFSQRASDFSAHLTILIEQFSSQARLGQVAQMRRGSFVGGLVQEPETVLGSRESGFGWYKGLRALTGTSPSTIESLLTELLSQTQRVQAASATGEVNAPEVAPLLALRLDSEGQALLRLIHSYSDWVLTIDRNLGIEYFDSPSAPDDSGYLLDYAPEFLQEDRQRILLTTRSTLELQSVIRPAIEKFGLTMPLGHEPIILDTLRSLSGRLALKLLSAESDSAEVVGLVLARWLMEQSGLLAEQVVIPLDAHRGWFSATGLTGRRADLLLIGLDASRRTVRTVIVEVKLREELTAGGRTSLYHDMHAQAEATEKRLRELFDPQLYPGPRADLPLRSKELTTALAFYLKRAARYGLLGAEKLSASLQFIGNLDSGYSLDVSALGVVFERQGSGAHLDEEEPGFVVHRFGLDIAQRLLSRACGEPSTEIPTGSDSSTSSVPPNSSRGGPPAATIGADQIISSFRSSLEDASVSSATPASTSPVPDAKHLAVPEAGLTSGSEVPFESPIRRTGTDAPQAVASPERATSPLSSQAPSRVISQDDSSVGTSALVDLAVLEQHRSTDTSNEFSNSMKPGILLGSHEITPQFGIIGRYSEATVALDLTGCNTISIFGVQGFGKSYTLGVIAEMATTAVQGINVLPAPLATVIFHYHKSDAYAPEFASAHSPNNKVREVDRLLREYGARPEGVKDIVLLTSEAKIDERREEFPELEIHPIKFSSGELGAESWKFLLGAYGNDSLYVRQLVAIMRRHREDLTLQRFREEILAADLSPQARRLAEDRLNLAEPYVDDSATLGSLIRPGRTIIVDLRDPWIEKDEALGLFVVLMRIFASTKHQGQPFNKLVVFDEAHKYISESQLIGQVVETIREMRHQATSVVIASQDPLSVPRSVIELTSILILHRMTSPQWLKHLKGAITGLEDVTEGHLAALQAGDALVWAQRSTDKRFSQRPYKVQIRPRFSLHGGGTKTAVPNVTVR
jgi:DNA phosphorothioation-dependent restriction protein DptH